MTNLPKHIIQVFEHQTIRLGDTINGVQFDDKTFQALALFQEKQPTKYYNLVYSGIRFSHYVGIIQIGALTIEILPKADTAKVTDAGKWQRVLIEMLRFCQLLKIESFGYGRIQLSSNTILDLYLERLLQQIQQLIKTGLPKQYLPKKANLNVLKGRLDLPQQLRKNQQHPERFFVKFQAFEYHHLFNQILHETIKVVQRIPLRTSLQLSLKQIFALFPKLLPYKVKTQDFDYLLSLKKYQPHRELLTLCRLIIFNFNPDVRGGNNHLFALLFDMNKLYEEYVYWQLKGLETDTIKVQRQTAKPFWQRRLIRPDLLLTIGNKRFVLDTKWKVMTNNTPAIEDLKQLYIYCQYFKAENGVLLFPKVHRVPNTGPIPFQMINEEKEAITAQILFLEIVEESGKLNKKLGKNLLEKLTCLSPIVD